MRRKVRIVYPLSLIFIALFSIQFTNLAALAQSQNLSTDRNSASSKISSVALAQHNKLKQKINRNTVTFVIEGESETQTQIARDLVNVISPESSLGSSRLRLLPILAQGGQQNAYDLLYLRGVDLAVMNIDTLAYLRGKNFELYRNVFNQVNYITKLYNAEWHVIGKQKYSNISELKNKKVNISYVGSGTYITSRNIFELLGIRPKYTHYSRSVALAKLLDGELDAVVVMDGSPVRALQNIPSNSGLHFVPVTFYYEDYFKVPLKNVLELIYLPTTLKHNQYPNLVQKNKPVPSVANSVVLTVIGLAKDSYRRKKIRRFISDFYEKIDQFTKKGRHLKWKEMNLGYNLPEWKRDQYAESLLTGLKKGSKLLVKNGVSAKILEYIKNNNDNLSNLSQEEKNELIRKFLLFLEKNKS